MSNHNAHSVWEDALAQLGYAWPEDCKPLTPLHRAASLCYIRSDDGILLLRRIQPPFVGHWTAPGGKIRPGETPEEAVRREVYEETELGISNPQLRMVVVERGPTPLLNWLLFIYRTSAFDGTPQRSDEGPLQWVAEDRLNRVGMPDVDLIVSRFVLTEDPPQWADIEFDDSGRTCRLAVTPLQTV